MAPTNLLFIISDQHNRDVLGCGGHPLAQTPHLDRLAEGGTRFANAYTNCPICVPARASLATGRYVHQIGNWDNAFPYDGSQPSWAHRLRDQGLRADSIGKLHFKGGDDYGWTEEIEPLHVVDGIGDPLGSIRQGAPFRQKRKEITGAGPGDSTYLRYDARNGDNACKWLSQRAGDEKPWVLFLSLVCPHPPYISPEELYELYPLDQVPLPPQWRQEDWPQHPALDYFRRYFGFDQPVAEGALRHFSAAYLGACTYVDGQIGRVLQTLSGLGLDDSTRVIYTSDHGESMGARGLFGKFTMYEEAAAVPLIVAGPDVPRGRVVDTAVSLVDCFPSVLEAVGARQEDQDLPGASLWEFAAGPERERAVFSEYHAVGSTDAAYMLRRGRFKYIHYVNAAPQLFDLAADPSEERDLAADGDFAADLQRLAAELRELLDPEATDGRAKAEQQALIEGLGGREAVIARGTFANSPVPGEAPAFQKLS